MNNQPTKRFLADYFHDGAWWGVDIYAYDFPDAEVRCKKLGLKFLGEHQMTIPAGTGPWLPNLIIRLRNQIKMSSSRNWIVFLIFCLFVIGILFATKLGQVN